MRVRVRVRVRVRARVNGANVPWVKWEGGHGDELIEADQGFLSRSYSMRNTWAEQNHDRPITACGSALRWTWLDSPPAGLVHDIKRFLPDAAANVYRICRRGHERGLRLQGSRGLCGTSAAWAAWRSSTRSSRTSCMPEGRDLDGNEVREPSRVSRH